MSNTYLIRVLIDGQVDSKDEIEDDYLHTAGRLYSNTVALYRSIDLTSEVTVQFINPDETVEYETTITPDN